MSEFLAEASVLIQANTVAFRAELAKALATVPKTIPIELVPVSSASASRAAKQSAAELAAASGVATSALKDENAERQRSGVILQEEERRRLRGARSVTKNAAEVRKGLVAQAASAVGLRGAIIGANSAFIIATAGAIAFGKSLQSAAQFQTELATFAATTGASAQQLEAVSAAAKQLGADITLPAVTAQDAAVAMTELAKAGLDVQQSIDGARGVLQLATAAQIDNAAATELAASALNAFGLSGGDAVHVADVLANAANAAQGSITDIGIALQQASAAGRQAGLSLEETTGILTVFARNGIKGSDAGTLLRTMLIRLINPTDKAQKIMDQLGLHIRDATGGINLGFFDEFARKTKDLTAAERDRDAAIIAGQDAFRGLSILSREGGVALDTQISGLNKAGTAADIAAARTSGLAGAAENLKNQLANAGLALGQSLAPGLTDLANFTASAVKRTQELVEGIGDLRDAAVRPIDIVVNFIRGGAERFGLPGLGGGDGGDGALTLQKRLSNLFSGDTLKGSGLDLLGNVRGILKEVDAELADHQLLLGPIGFPTLTQARKQIKDLVDELNKTPTPTKFNETVLALREIQKQMAGGTLGTKEFAKTLGPFITRLQNLSATNVQIPEIKFPPSLEQGADEAAKKTGGKFGSTFIPIVGAAFKTAAEQGWKESEGTIDPGVTAFTAAVSQALASSRSRTGALVSQQINLEFQGASTQELRANLEKTLASQRATVAELVKKGAKRTAIDAARQDAIATQDAIDQIDEQAKTAAEQAANKRKQDAQKVAQARSAADQDFLDALTGGRAPVERKVTRAERSETLLDDIRRQQQLRTRVLAEIDAISKRDFADTKAKASAISARRDQLTQIDNTIFGLQQQQAGVVSAATSDRFNLQVSIAQASGNSRALIKLFDQRIHDLNVAISKAKENSNKQLELKNELLKVQQSREDAISSLEEKRIQLADLRGNKNAELDFINDRIARLKRAIAAAKKQHKATIDLELELAQTQKDRKDLLDEAKDDNKQATTAFDLLKQAADTFNQNAGNLIGGNQPFAGPTGFTADIAQFLIRRQPPPGTTPQFPGKAADNTLVQANTRLTDAIIDLTDEIRTGGKGNGSTATRVQSVRASRQWHSENMLARQFQEG